MAGNSLQRRRNRVLRVKHYIRTDYAKFWLEQVQRYGFLPYHANLLGLITSLTAPGNGRLLEVGVGTGWPFAKALVQQGYTVYGMDIAELMVQEARAHLGGSRCLVGDAEALPWVDESFDLVYCLQSTWYFPDLARALAELVRVTRSGGSVVFDVMNLASRRIFLPKVSPRCRWALSNIRRMLLRRPLLPVPFDHEHPTTPWQVSQILHSLPVSWCVVLPEEPQRTATGPDYFHYRLVYICTRKGKEH